VDLKAEGSIPTRRHPIGLRFRHERVLSFDLCASASDCVWNRLAAWLDNRGLWLPTGLGIRGSTEPTPATASELTKSKRGAGRWRSALERGLRGKADPDSCVARMDLSARNDRFLEGSFPIIPATGTEVGHLGGEPSVRKRR